jgi:hypothetical protein
MSTLTGQGGELRLTIEIKRKGTGEVETVELVGSVNQEQAKETRDGSDALDSGTERGH